MPSNGKNREDIARLLYIGRIGGYNKIFLRVVGPHLDCFAKLIQLLIHTVRIIPDILDHTVFFHLLSPVTPLPDPNMSLNCSLCLPQLFMPIFPNEGYCQGHSTLSSQRLLRAPG